MLIKQEENDLQFARSTYAIGFYAQLQRNYQSV